VQDPDENDTEMGMRKAQHGNAPDRQQSASPPVAGR
jgi:hypothetical protein